MILTFSQLEIKVWTSTTFRGGQPNLENLITSLTLANCLQCKGLSVIL